MPISTGYGKSKVKKYFKPPTPYIRNKLQWDDNIKLLEKYNSLLYQFQLIDCQMIICLHRTLRRNNREDDKKLWILLLTRSIHNCISTNIVAIQFIQLLRDPKKPGDTSEPNSGHHRPLFYRFKYYELRIKFYYMIES